MTIRNLQEANEALLPYVPLVSQLTGKHTTLDRIIPLMEHLGNPQNRLRAIHIAGTSGKTSTAYYMAELLRAGGQKTGLTVSPHVDSVMERVQINGRPLAEDEFCRLLGEFMDLVREVEQQPSYFELLYAFAIWVFDRQNVDYAVIETGMGGMYDATNVITRPDKVCVITDIGFDHTHLLGGTLPEITAQKIGIAHDHNAVLMYEQADEIMAVVRNWTSNHKAELTLLDETAEQRAYSQDLAPIAGYQQRNWLLAYGVYRYLEKRDSLKHLTNQELQKIRNLQIPGRMDSSQAGSKTIIMDGAHNLQKMTAFINSFKDLYPGARPAVLLALKDDKEYEKLLPLLIGLSDRFVVTMFNTTQDLPVRSMNPEALGAALKKAGAGAVEVIPGQAAAVKALLSGREDTCVITGSFYLLSQIRNNVNLL